VAFHTKILKIEDSQLMRVERRFSCLHAKGGEDDCWPWLGSKTEDGYGQFKLSGEVVVASRVAFALANGEVPEGNVVCHSCDFPSCVNPRHLSAKTQSYNVRDCVRKGRHGRGGGGPTGPANGSYKLSDDEVKAVRALARKGESKTVIARRFGISRDYVYKLINNKKRAE